MIGFSRMSSAAPNDGHRAIASLQRQGLLRHLITQNVDRLHQAAGSTGVLELHGTIHEVECVACLDWAISRSDLQNQLLAANAGWLAEWAPSSAPRPDGDVELPPEAYATFEVPR